MEPENLQPEDVFCTALELASPGERAAYLDKACGADLALRQRVERLLNAHAQAGSFLAAQPEVAAQTCDAPAEITGTVIGPYKLLEQIGEGGMGTVWMAQQTEPITRLVALKLIKAGMDSKQVIARFEAERQALALMDHPNIAKVLDAGTVGQTEKGVRSLFWPIQEAVLAEEPGPKNRSDTFFAGRPYFVMELVKGVPITKYCDEHRLTPRQRLELFVPVCQAVQHAHQKGIIHRDLKPSNVLVALYDGKPVPKVIDFGVAKATGQPLTEQTLVTGFGNIVGTLEYMSPEQAEINQLDIDTRSDIYSLGVLLYELLAGSTPFTRKELEKAGMLEMLRVIREQEPSKPSTKLSTAEGLPTLAANRGTEPAKLTKLVRGELDWIVMKALEKDRNRRYDTANGFAMDVQRYLADEAVLACPPSVGYRLRKFVRRNKGPVLAVSLVLLALVVGMIGTTWGMIRATHAEAEALHETKQKETALREREAALGTAKANELEAQKQETLAKENEKNAKFQELLARRRFYAAQLILAQQSLETDNIARALDLLETQRPRFGQEDLRTFEWYYLWRQCHRGHRFTLEGWKGQTRLNGGLGSTRHMAISPDGQTLAVGGWDERVRLWDLATGRLQATLECPSSEDLVTCVAYSSDGRTLAVGHWHVIELWDVATNRLKWSTRSPDRLVWSLAFSPDGKLLATGAQEPNSVRLWDLASRQNVATFSVPGRGVQTMSVAFAPDGQTLAAGGWGENVALWDVPTRKELFIGRGNCPIAFLPNGTFAYCAGGGEGAPPIRVVDARTGKEQSVLQTGGRLWMLSPNTKIIAMEGSDRNVRIYDLATRQHRTHHGRLTTITCILFSPDGRTLVSGAEDGRVEVWDAFPVEDAPIIKQEMLKSLVFSRDGTTLVAASATSAKIVEVDTGRLVADIPISPEWIGTSCALFPDGKTLAAAGKDGRIRLLDVRTKRELAVLQGHKATVDTVAFSPDGKTLASGGLDATCILWDVGTRTPRITLKPGTRVTTVAFSPDSRIVATVTQQGITKLWDVASGKQMAVLHGTALGAHHWVWDAAFSADGKTLATTGTYGSVKLWDVEQGVLRGDFVGHTFTVNSVALFGDGQTMVTADVNAKFWCPDTGQERMTLKNVRHVALSPDGQTLALGERDGTVRLIRTQYPPRQDGEAAAFRTELDSNGAESPSRDIHGANHLYASGRLEEAVAAYQKALSRLEKLAGHAPQIPEYRAELAYCNFALSLALQARALSQEAVQSRQAGLDVYQKLVAEFPTSAALHSYPIERLFGLWYLVERSSPFRETAHLLSLFEGMMDAAGAVAPFNSSRFTTIGYLWLRLGNEAENAGNLEAARKHWNKAIAYTTKAIALDPQNPHAWGTRALARGRLCQHEEALADQTIVDLREAIQRGLPNAEAMLKHNTSFDVLRSREEFKKLLTELEAKKK